jgi:ABC-2 type transport system ATP-binding protein
MNEPLVTLTSVFKKFEKEPSYALDNISATIPKGEIVGLVGPDGSGKTTLIRLIAGLLMPTKGQIAIDGFDSIKDAEALHAILGYMPQKFGLYEDLTVEQNLIFYSDLRGLDKSQREAAFKKLLTFTGLTPFTKRLAGALSGGMKQKLGLACALIKKPKLLLLDEPSVGVDPISRRELWKMVQELIDEGISVIWSTAYLDEAEKCNTVLLLNEGKLVYHGAPNQLTDRVHGRVFLITNIATRRHELLSKALLEPNVLDGIIQANDIRIVFKKDTTCSLDLIKLGADIQASLIPTNPRFEDAFIDILGDTICKSSLLAEKTTQIPCSDINPISVTDLTKRFGNFTAVDNISLEIKSGEIFGLLGPNGAGKTTTFKMMCGLLKPTSGMAFVNGVDLLIAPSIARGHIGYMAQKFSLYGDLSVYENLEFYSGIYNLKGTKQKEAIDEMIEIFHFAPFLKERTELLPLGYKQRLALSCAVMHRPQILFLDEPTSGVDPKTRREFWGHINGLVEKGITVLISTHFMDEAEYCDRIGLVYRSKLITIGSPQFLKEQAVSEENRTPTLEDAFIGLIKLYDEAHPV